MAVNGCCEWCSKVAGRYAYGEEPDDIYRRHDNCGCSVTYENGRKRQDVWSKREWEAPEPGAGAGDPVVLTKEQAKILQAEHGLTILSRNDTINLEANHFIQSLLNLVNSVIMMMVQWLLLMTGNQKER